MKSTDLLASILIKVDESLPTGTIYLISDRKMVGDQLEPIEDWAKRCGVIKNVGTNDK